MSYLDRLNESLAAIRARGRYRSLRSHQLENAIDFSSNDYLALATDARVALALKQRQRVGSGGARLLGGRHREHSMLEEELASWLGRERALLFSSGYHAALGAVTVLASAVHRIYSDELNHASLIDGMRLARAPRSIYPHAALPPKDEREHPALIVTESIFSMDGDAVDLHALLADLHDDDVLLVDEAHALGVVGPEGAGLAYGLDDPRVVVLGTLSKSLGAHGGFIAGPAVVIEALVNMARTFIFDTALPPAIALAARVAIKIARVEEDRRERLHASVRHLRAGLDALGIATITDPSPVVPVVLGSEERAVRVAEELAALRLIAPAIRPPTVPVGSSRLRLSLRADLSTDHVDLLVRSLQRCLATS
ncbi:MAG: 8-amino-7-oxononanoate synthase [bacterium]|nr:8-amino-7-oxononanoate synthase [bacterium]